jgi:hypothetical protein
MPFDPNYQYGQATQGVDYEAVPAEGRKVVSADFAAIYVNGKAIGLVQEFAPSETRDVQAQFELGNIYPVEFVPLIWEGTITASRVELFLDAVWDAFQINNGISQYGLSDFWPSGKTGPSYGTGFGNTTSGQIVTTIADVQWPLNIQVYITTPATQGNNKLVDVWTYTECWITSYNKSFNAQNKVVAENVNFKYRTIQRSQAQLIGLGNGINAATI